MGNLMVVKPVTALFYIHPYSLTALTLSCIHYCMIYHGGLVDARGIWLMYGAKPYIKTNCSRHVWIFHEAQPSGISTYALNSLLKYSTRSRGMWIYHEAQPSGISTCQGTELNILPYSPCVRKPTMVYFICILSKPCVFHISIKCQF